MFKSLLKTLDHAFPMCCVLLFVVAVISFSAALSADIVIGMYQLK